MYIYIERERGCHSVTVLDEAILLQANLLLHGCSMEQVQFFTASREAALARRLRLRAWDSATPPMIRQTFGLRNSRRQGVQIPVPVHSDVPCLPALRPTMDFIPPALTWLQECFPHKRDACITFHQEVSWRETLRTCPSRLC